MSAKGVHPETVAAAVRLLLDLMPSDDQARIVAMSKEVLTELHLGLGMWVRNNLGLWSGNGALLQATDRANADDASMVIVEALWQHLREGLPKLH